MMSLLIELAESFNQPDLARELQNETLYSSANDYKSTSEDRLFCTHCGDKAVVFVGILRIEFERASEVELCPFL